MMTWAIRLQTYRARIRDARKLMDGCTIPTLSADQKAAVDARWKSFRFKRNYDWHRWFSYVGDAGFDDRYVPYDVYELELIPRLQNLPLAKAWADKSYYRTCFPEVALPATLACCIDGMLVDGRHRATTFESVVDAMRERGRVLVKPALDSSVGKGVEIWDLAELDSSSIRQDLLSYGRNYVVQEVLAQHETLHRLNESSCNILRIYSLRMGDRTITLNPLVRFGVPGSCTDVCFVDGKEALNLVGVTNDGRFREKVFSANGSVRNLADCGGSPGAAVPGFAQACDIALHVHERLHHFDLVGFDFAIDQGGNPVLLEYNLVIPGVVFPQYAHGPFFGHHTDEVLERLQSLPPKSVGR